MNEFDFKNRITILYISILFLLYGYIIQNGDKFLFTLFAYGMSILLISLIPYFRLFFNKNNNYKISIIVYVLLCLIFFYSINVWFSFSFFIFYGLLLIRNNKYKNNETINLKFKPINIIKKSLSKIDFIIILMILILSFVILFIH
jgi:hypothetical protein